MRVIHRLPATAALLVAVLSLGVAQGTWTAPARVAHAAAGDPAAIRACQFSGPEVWLTFDDSVKGNIVQILGEHDVRGIFFPTGSFARRYPAEVAKAIDAGHLVGNHSDTHPRLTALSDSAVLAEIDGGVRGTETPGLLRPPYGAYDARIVDLAASRGYRLCTWTVASGDSGGASAAQIIANAAKLRSGGVFILHPNAAHTAEALPGVIAAIRANGLTLAPL
jgi:peptidoglycan/xylan/chitin deacetylase (PgdA/CDA1 family)